MLHGVEEHLPEAQHGIVGSPRAPDESQQRQPDGKLLKIEVGNEVGAEAMKVTKVSPLYLTVALDKPSSSGASGEM